MIAGEGDNSFQLTLNPECMIYKAHFPGHPVTPGVCIIQIALELLEILLERKVELKEVVNAKFLSVIDPEETPEVSYEFSKSTYVDNQVLKVAVAVSSPSAKCAKLSLLCSVDE